MLNKRIKKILLVFTTLILLISSVLQPFVSSVSAQTTWYNQSPMEWYLKVYDTDATPADQIFGERYTAAQVQWIIWSLGAMLINTITFGHTDLVTCLLDGGTVTCADETYDAFKEMDEWVEEIASNNTFSTFASTFGKSPISGIAYTKKLISKFNPVTTVNAQSGFGYTTAGNSILLLWQITRNLAFSLLIIAIIVISFLIMFRVKIAPQVVITVQSAIPKIISAIILITFSYAIAGFLIDLMYVSIGLLATFIKGYGLSNHDSLFTEFTSGENAIGLLWEFWFAFMIVALASTLSSWNPLTYLVGIILFIFAFLFVVFAVINTFKILALLFKNFVHILLGIVTGPIEILMGTVIQGAGIGPWIRKMFSYLAVYPVMALMFFLAFFFLAQAYGMTAAGKLANLIGNDFLEMFPFNPNYQVINRAEWDPPLSTFVIDGQAILWAIVGYVIITLVPKTTEIVQGFISGKPFAYGTAIGEATGVIQNAAGRVGNWAYGASGLRGTVDIIRAIRESRAVGNILDKDSRTGRIAEKAVGGKRESARGALNMAQKGMREKQGIETNMNKK